MVTSRWSARAQRTVAALALVAGLLILTRDRSLPPLGAFLIVSDALRPADAIVPLAGERSRVSYAAMLYDRGEAGSFVITDMWIDSHNRPGTYAGMIQRQAARAGVSRPNMVLAPGTVASTYAEALALRELAQRQRWHSLIVVTSPFHTRRAGMILRQVFADTGISVSIASVAPHWYQPDTWWRSWQGWQITLSEYCKLALYLIGYNRVFN